ncbi:MAG: GC-type dockerin domain-anchored protein [Planctomycetota bacterium]
MKTSKFVVPAYIALAHTTVSAQSATVSLVAPSVMVAPGASVAIDLVVDYSTGTAGAGVFGPAGLYGFGGEMITSGPAAGSISGSGTTTAAFLPLGPFALDNPGGSGIARCTAGRLLSQGGLPGSSQVVASFNVDIEAGASPGDSVTIDYEGAVVLSQDDRLVTYSTTPGVNQESLSTVSLTLTIGGGRLCADQNNDGLVTPADFNGWILNFNQGSLLADTNQDGAVTPADFNGWILAFNAGANGPICTP